MEREYYECQCGCAEHTLCIAVDTEDGLVTTEVFLSHYHPWYRCLWIAVKYVFGFQSKSGAFGAVLLQPVDYPCLHNLFE